MHALRFEMSRSVQSAAAALIGWRGPPSNEVSIVTPVYYLASKLECLGRVGLPGSWLRTSNCCCACPARPGDGRQTQAISANGRPSLRSHSPVRLHLYQTRPEVGGCRVRGAERAGASQAKGDPGDGPAYHMQAQPRNGQAEHFCFVCRLSAFFILCIFDPLHPSGLSGPYRRAICYFFFFSPKHPSSTYLVSPFLHLNLA